MVLQSKMPQEISLVLQYLLRILQLQKQILMITEQLLKEQRQHFSLDPDAARRLLSVGDSPVPEDVDPVELAAYTSIGRILMNLSEFVTKG